MTLFFISISGKFTIAVYPGLLAPKSGQTILLSFYKLVLAKDLGTSFKAYANVQYISIPFAVL